MQVACGCVVFDPKLNLRRMAQTIGVHTSLHLMASAAVSTAIAAVRYLAEYWAPTFREARYALYYKDLCSSGLLLSQGMAATKSGTTRHTQANQSPNRE
jgi:hypothetical protein